MSLIYRKVPQCKICNHTRGAEIDQALLDRKSYGSIVEQFATMFPNEEPLTKSGVYRHYKHVEEAVKEIMALQMDLAAKTAPATSPALNPANAPHSLARQQTFHAIVQDRLNEVEVMERLAISGIRDLELLEKDIEQEVDYELEKKLARNKIRRDTASITMGSAKVKEMVTKSQADQQRLEKGRIVFRMMELLKKSLEVVPQELRPVVAERLKDAFKADDELRDLLKVHSQEASEPAALGQGGTA